MSDQPWSDWYSAPELAPRLGMSTATLKRRLSQWTRDARPILLTDGRSVEIQAEKVMRPQGDEWRVRVRGALPDASDDPERTDSKGPPPLTSAQSDDQGFLRLIETERAERQRIAAENAELRERAVRAETMVEAKDATISALSAARDAQQARADDLAERLKQAEQRIADRRWWKPSTW